MTVTAGAPVPSPRPNPDGPGVVYDLGIPLPGTPDGIRKTLLNQNESKNRHAWARKTKHWREVGKVAAVSALNRGRLIRLDRARIDVTFYWPDDRRRDVANWYPTAKALLDGIVDAGALPDDSDKHVRGPFPHRGKGATAILITITPLNRDED